MPVFYRDDQRYLRSDAGASPLGYYLLFLILTVSTVTVIAPNAENGFIRTSDLIPHFQNFGESDLLI